MGNCVDVPPPKNSREAAIFQKRFLNNNEPKYSYDNGEVRRYHMRSYTPSIVSADDQSIKSKKIKKEKNGYSVKASTPRSQGPPSGPPRGPPSHMFYCQQLYMPHYGPPPPGLPGMTPYGTRPPSIAPIIPVDPHTGQPLGYPYDEPTMMMAYQGEYYYQNPEADRRDKRSNNKARSTTSSIPPMVIPGHVIASEIRPDDNFVLQTPDPALVAFSQQTSASSTDDVYATIVRHTDVHVHTAEVPQEVSQDSGVAGVNTTEQKHGLRDDVSDSSSDDGVAVFQQDSYARDISMDALLVEKSRKKNKGPDLFGILNMVDVSTTKPVDVVVCHGDVDAELAAKIKAEVWRTRVTSWVAGPSDTRSDMEREKNAHLIANAKIVVIVMSVRGVKSAALRDEVCLACLTHTLVVPVCVDDSLDVLDAMPLSLKLQLAGIKWEELGNLDQAGHVTLFVRHLFQDLEVFAQSAHVIHEDYGEVSAKSRRPADVTANRQLLRSVSVATPAWANDFWEKHFKGEHKVDWNRFKVEFIHDFRSIMTSTIPEACHAQVMQSMRRELEVDEEGFLSRTNFITETTDNDSDLDLWRKTVTVARETLALRAVLDVGSTVRGVALENIERFGSPSLHFSLQDLLVDEDANMRAVTALALGKCSSSKDVTIVEDLTRALGDQDMLVREAACLALGMLKSTWAVGRLVEAWRKNTGPVSEAAAEALQEIGGKEAEAALKKNTQTLGQPGQRYDNFVKKMMR